MIPDKFIRAFTHAQKTLGLGYYKISFEPFVSAEAYATTAPDPEGCTATVKYDLASLEKDRKTHLIAVHEVLHLLTTELMFAAAHSPDKIAQRTEERFVRALDEALTKGIFPNRK